MRADGSNVLQNDMESMKNNSIFSAAFQAMLRSSPDIVFVKDTALRYLAVSDACVKALGKNGADAVIGRTAAELVTDPALVRLYHTDDRALLDGKKDLVDHIQPVPDENGQPRYSSVSKYILSDDKGAVTGILGILRDATREHIARQHYQQALQLLFKLPKDTYAAVFFDIDDWRLVGKRAQLVRGRTLPVCNSIDDLYEFAMSGLVNSGEATSFYLDFSREGFQEIYRSGRSLITFSCQRRLSDDQTHWVHNKIQFLLEEKNGHLCAVFSIQDIDKQKQAEQELAMAAHTDRMTMLLNRAATLRQIRNTLGMQPNQRHAFFILDADNFKMLNDTLGHQAGDEFLVGLAQILRSNFRENDVIGRLGGDEFLVLMKNILNPQMATQRTQVLLTAVQALSANFPSVPLSASIGIALYPEDGKTLEELYEKADAAMYRAKKGGKNRFYLAAAQGTETQPEQPKGVEKMTLKEFYAAQGGDYQDVIDRLHSEEIIIKFLIRFLEDPCFEKLKQAVAENRREDAFVAVHTLKGTCMNMGLGTLAESAKYLTEAVRTQFSPDVPELLRKVEEDYESTVSAIRMLKASCQL